MGEAIPVVDLKTYMRGRTPGPFKPVPFFSVRGNFLSVYFEDEEGYAETLNERVTVIRAFSDKRIVGVKLFEVPELIALAIMAQGGG